MPYLMHLPFDVALRELHLESNPEFVALLAKHAALCEDPDRAGGAEAKRLERAMRDWRRELRRTWWRPGAARLWKPRTCMRSTRACRRSRRPVLPLWKWVWWRIPCFARCRTSWTVCALTRPKMRNRLRRRRGRCVRGRWSLVPRSCRQPKRSNAITHFFRDAWMTCL
ncbi:hypothetical protein C3747_197g44 [Trypanosoma cruzi]|uniref:DUF7623 domain-containing protein n=1 Tax=Trypanosoma cruzi TaxID=5693 RepID=A0A2V2VYX3_TRYCR|nr:hypothetical protein C3747_197g44 [Trypanosoma cruzi]